MGILDKMNEETTVTRKLENGTTVTIKSPKGAQVNMAGILGGQVAGPDMGPTADNVTARLTPGEFVVNRPAAQKYMPVLEKINNEGKRMLAMGGHVPGYAYGGMTRARSDAEAASGMYGYATDSDPIVSSGNPAQMAAMAAQQMNIPATDYNLEKLEGLAMEVIVDWGSLPDYEKQEWGSMMELWDYYLQDFIHELQLDGYPCGGEVKGYNQGGMVNNPGLSADAAARIRRWLEDPNLSQRDRDILTQRLGIGVGYAKGGMVEKDLEMMAQELGAKFTPEKLEKVDMIINNTEGNAAMKAAAVAEYLGVEFTDYNLEMIEKMVAEFTGEEFVGYWSGGEVEGQASAGATPDEGDSITIKGQTVYYRNGQWVYASGKPAPGYVTSGIQAMIAPVAAEAAGGDPMVAEDAPTASAPVDIEKESHAKNYTWGKRAIEAEKVIRELIAGGFNPGSIDYARGETAANWLGDLARTTEGQRYKKAVESLVAAVLRKDTGAAIAADEFDRTYRQLFPSVGTGPEAQQDAANQRQQNIEAFIASAGPGAAELREQLGDTFEQQGASDAPLITGEEAGGLGGGIIGGVAGGVLGGPLGAAAGAGLGTWLGRVAGQYFSTDDDILESLTPEASDIIDSAISAAGGAAVKAGSVAYKAAKAAVARRVQQTGASTADEVANIAKEIAEKGVVKGVASSAGSAVSKVFGRVNQQYADDMISKGYRQAAFGNRPYFVKVNNDGSKSVIDAVTQKAIRGKNAKDVIKAAGLDKDPGFAYGGKVKGILG